MTWPSLSEYLTPSAPSLGANIELDFPTQVNKHDSMIILVYIGVNVRIKCYVFYL